MSVLEDFKSRLLQEWLVPFCRAGGHSHEGFDGRAMEKLSPADASDFMQAIDSGLVCHRDGAFTAALSRAKEYIFWHGKKSSEPRKVTLWLEPIITIAGLMRLRRDYSWNSEQLGLQSKTWAFDLVGYNVDLQTESLVCEVKKSQREIEVLLELIRKHEGTPAEAMSSFKGSERNAFKKVVALRQSNCNLFWMLGPNRYGHVFNIVREPNGLVQLSPVKESSLKAPN